MWQAPRSEVLLSHYSSMQAGLSASQCRTEECQQGKPPTPPGYLENEGVRTRVQAMWRRNPDCTLKNVIEGVGRALNRLGKSLCTSGGSSFERRDEMPGVPAQGMAH